MDGCHMCVGTHEGRSEEGLESLEAGVIGGWEPIDVDVESGTGFLWMTSVDLGQLSNLSRLVVDGRIYYLIC